MKGGSDGLEYQSKVKKINHIYCASGEQIVSNQEARMLFVVRRRVYINDSNIVVTVL